MALSWLYNEENSRNRGESGGGFRSLQLTPSLNFLVVEVFDCLLALYLKLLMSVTAFTVLEWQRKVFMDMYGYVCCLFLAKTR